MHMDQTYVNSMATASGLRFMRPEEFPDLRRPNCTTTDFRKAIGNRKAYRSVTSALQTLCKTRRASRTDKETKNAPKVRKAVSARLAKGNL